MQEIGPEFSSGVISDISSKISYLNGTSIGMIVLTLISVFVLVPLFNRITSRILSLMKLFFTLDPLLISSSILTRIDHYQKQIQSKQLDRQQIKLMNEKRLQLKEEREKRERDQEVRRVISWNGPPEIVIH